MPTKWPPLINSRSPHLRRSRNDKATAAGRPTHQRSHPSIRRFARLRHSTAVSANFPLPLIGLPSLHRLLHGCCVAAIPQSTNCQQLGRSSTCWEVCRSAVKPTICWESNGSLPGRFGRTDLKVGDVEE